jgi:hypothetical protein
VPKSLPSKAATFGPMPESERTEAKKGSSTDGRMAGSINCFAFLCKPLKWFCTIFVLIEETGSLIANRCYIPATYLLMERLNNDWQHTCGRES